jgi:hypothetical protein
MDYLPPFAHTTPKRAEGATGDIGMAGSKERYTAEFRFSRTQKPVEKPGRVKTEQEESKRAVDEKTARLKAQRLSRETAAMEKPRDDKA